MNIYKNLKRNRYIYSILFLIFIASQVFCIFIYENVNDVNTYNNYLESYFNIPNTYFLIATHSIEDHKFVTKLDKIREDGSIIPFDIELLQQADKKSLESFGVSRNGIYFSSNINIKEVREDRKFNKILPKQKNNEEYPNLGLFVNDLIGENVKFPLFRGRNFKDKDFSEKEFFPIIAGYDFSKKNKIGDMLNINMPRYSTQENENNVPVKIIGFLKKDTRVATYIGSADIINADNLIIIGISEFKNDSSFLSNFNRTLNGLIETKDPKLVEDKVLELARSLGYEGNGGLISLYKVKDAFKDVFEFDTKSLITYFKIFGISIFISIVITLIATYSIIRKNKYYIGVLLIYGATKNKVRTKILLEMIVVLILSNIISSIMALNYFGTINPIIIMAYNFLIIMISIITSTIILKNKKTIQFINFNEQN